MEINKRCITAFSRNETYVALATKSKLFDNAFSLTSELILVNYMTGESYPPITTDLKFCKILWCEFKENSYLVAGHENGHISIYSRGKEGLTLIASRQCLEDDISALDFLPSKGILVAATSKGKIIFWTLSNLEKEYTLDIPLSLSISSIAWNPKVSKILCVGTTDGIIKVLDIKKNAVILTLSNKDLTEVKHLEWDAENNTKLNVMSDRGYILSFDLSNDSISKTGNHPDPLISFYKNILVSKSLLETNGITIKIEDSFECSISKKDPVICLSHMNGTTRILSIPTMKATKPFSRIANLIVTPQTFKKILFENEAEVKKIDLFYNEFIKLVNAEQKPSATDIANFLLENSSSVSDKNLTVDVDITDKFSLDLIKGDLSGIVNEDIPIDFKILDVFINKDLSVLSDITDFKVLFVICKILNNYSPLAQVKNPRVLASAILFNGINDFTLLEKSKEGIILKSILTGDFNEYINAIATPGISYLEKMKQMDNILADINEFNKSPLNYVGLVDYFWYKVFIGGAEKVRTLNIQNKDVQFYLRMNSLENIEQNMRNMNIGTKAFNAGSRESARPTGPAPVANNFAFAPAQQNIQKAGPAMASVASNATNYYTTSTTAPCSAFNPMGKTSASQPPQSFNPPSSNLYNLASGSSINASQQAPNMGFGQFSRQVQAPTPPQPTIAPQPSIAPIAPQPTIASMAPKKPIAPRSPTTSYSCIPQPPKTPIMGSASFSSMNNPQGSGIPSASAAQHPSIPQPKTPLMGPTSFASMTSGFPQRTSTSTPSMAPKSPFLGSLPTKDNRFASIPSPPSSGSRYSAMPMPQRNTYIGSQQPPVTNPNLLGVQNVTNQSNEIHVENPSQIISDFEGLVASVRHKASLATSLILKQRKLQYLNALSTYDSVNKNSLSSSILYAMDLIVKRANAGGEMLKSDLNVLVDGYNDVVWLKALVELIKMLY